MSNNVLTSAFEKKRRPQSSVADKYKDEKPLVPMQVRGRNKGEEKRLISFINAIAENSPFGKAVLEDACNDGYKLVFEKQKESCGFCDPDSKTIALNPVMTDDLLVATLAHEGRHAQQFTRGAVADFGQFNVKSELMYLRAMEADAETAAAATCHEIKVLGGKEGPWNDFSADSVDIAEGFLGAANGEKSPVTNKMLQAAFEGWYKDEMMVEAYEEGYIQDVMTDAMRCHREVNYPYDKKVDSASVVSLFCANAKGNCYWADNMGVLNDPEKLVISAETHRVCDKFFDVRAIRTGLEADKSYKELIVRDPQNLKGAKHGKRKGKSKPSQKAARVLAEISELKKARYSY